MDPFYHTLFQCSIAAGNEEIVLNHRYCIIKIYLVTGHSVETRDQLGNSTYISRSSIRVWIEYQHKQTDDGTVEEAMEDGMAVRLVHSCHLRNVFAAPCATALPNQTRDDFSTKQTKRH